MNADVQVHHEVGALSHLVEAASALAKLNVLAPPSQHPPAVVLAEGDEQSQSVVTDEEDSTRLQAVPACNSSKREIFPQRLMAILNDAGLSDVVSWLPHGRSFVIIRPDVFTERVLPRYLPPADARSSTKYPSFTRKLNRWGFRQATRGPDTGAFYHPCFRRDKPELCLDMICVRSRDRKSLSSTKKSKETHLDDACEVAADTTTIPAPQLPLQNGCTIVTEDSSHSQSAPPASAGTDVSCTPIPARISTDSALIKTILERRDEIERMRVARAILYQSFINVVNEN